MAWSVVQHALFTPSGLGTSAAKAYTSNITAGNLLVVAASGSGTSVPTLSVTDSAGNSYNQMLTSTETADNQRVSIFTAPITAGVGTAPTVTLHSTVSAGLVFSILEVSGIANTIDKSATNNASTATTAPVSGTTAATTAANEFCIAMYGDSGIDTSLVVGSGWTDEGTVGNNANDNGSCEVKDSGASGSTIQATWTSSSSPYAALVAVFQLGSAAVATTPFAPHRMPLGV